MIAKLLKKLTELKKNEIIYSIESDKEIENLFTSKKDLITWQKAIVKKGIILKGIGSIQALNFFKKNIDQDLKTILSQRAGSSRFVETKIYGYCTMIIYRNNTVFFSRNKKFFHEINNEFISSLLRNLLDDYFNRSKFIPIV